MWDDWPTVPDTSESATHVLAGRVALAVLVWDDPVLSSVRDEFLEAVDSRLDQLPEPARPLADDLSIPGATDGRHRTQTLQRTRI